MQVAIIGGTGFYDPGSLDVVREHAVVTPYGRAHVLTGRVGGMEVGFLARHGSDHSIPPHRVNYRANVWALHHLGVRWVLATAATGSLNPEFKPGDLVLLDQFMDFTRGRPATFFDGGEAGVVHTDFTEPYCPALRAIVAEAARAEGIPLHPRATYVCTDGPRFETPSEIRAFRTLGGDLVGMTNVPEVVLAREAGLCYATVAIVTNWAAGISPSPLSHEEVLEVMAGRGAALRRLFDAALGRLPPATGCGCGAGAGRPGGRR